MMICKVVILLASLAALASVGCSGEELRGQVLVRQLEKFLVENLPDSEDVATNIKKLDEVDASLKLGADALRALASYKGGCDTDVREALGLFRFLRWNGFTRIEKLLFQLVPKVSTMACLEALKKEFNSVASTGDRRVDAMVSRFGSTWRKHFKIYHDPLEYYHMYLSYRDFFDRKRREKDFARAISTDVIALAGDDPKARFVKDISSSDREWFPEKFGYAFETYLLKPCKKYYEKTWKLYETFYGVSKLLKNPTLFDEFKGEREHKYYAEDWNAVKQFGMSKYLPGEFQAGLFTYRRCKVYTQLDQETVNESFRSSHVRDYKSNW